MPKYRQIIDAIQWMRPGDHPDVWDYFACYPARVCNVCGHMMMEHGHIVAIKGNLIDDHLVCPGDYIITKEPGDSYPVKQSVFEDLYEPLDDEGER